MFYWLNWKLDQLENSKFENWTKLTKSDKIEKVRKDKFVEPTRSKNQFEFPIITLTGTKNVSVNQKANPKKTGKEY